MVNCRPKWNSLLVLSVLCIALSAFMVSTAKSQQVRNITDKKQLFIDNRFIMESAGVNLNVNPAEKLGIVLDSETSPWTDFPFGYSRVIEDQGVVKMYYNGEFGGQIGLAYAESTDGINFTKPSLGLVQINGQDTNVISIDGGTPDSMIFLDPHDVPERRYKLFNSNHGDGVTGVKASYSADGIHFTDAGTVFPMHAETGAIVEWDDRIQKYVVYTKILNAPYDNVHHQEGYDTVALMNGQVVPVGHEHVRAVGRIETDDILQPWPFTPGSEPSYVPTASNVQMVLTADGLDDPRSDVYTNGEFTYPWAEDVQLMFPTAFRHFDPSSQPWFEGQPVDTNGPLEPQLAVSRDGVAWDRPEREPYINFGLGDEYDRWNVQVIPGMVKRGNYLYQYYKTSGGLHSSYSWRPEYDDLVEMRPTISVARQRLDGFVSADFDYTGGTLTTPTIIFTGDELRLNLNAGAMGSLFVEIRDEQGNPIPGYTLADSEEVGGNFVDMLVRWNGESDLSSLAGTPVQLYFSARATKLYAFQFSCNECGDQWAADSLGEWQVASNWTSNEVPDGNAATAAFGDVITAPTTVYTNSPVTVKEIRFTSSVSYGIAGLGNVTFDSDAGNPLISVDAGSHQFQTAVNLADDTDVQVASGAKLEFNNTLNLGGHTLSKTGSGALVINGQVVTGGGSIAGLSGLISGSGAVLGDLANTSATVAPGNSPGILTIGGNYVQGPGGTLAIEIGGTMVGAQYDQLVVEGSAELSGTILIDLINSFALKSGDVFEVLTAESISDLGLSVAATGENLWLRFRIVNLESGGQALRLTVVPEPASACLLVCGVAVLLLRRAPMTRRKAVHRSRRWGPGGLTSAGYVALSIAASVGSHAARADVITPVGATASSEYDNGEGDVRPAIDTINSTGLDPSLGDVITKSHNEAPSVPLNGGMWMNAEGQGSTGTITFDLGDFYELTDLHVWNYGEYAYACCDLTTRGSNEVDVYIGDVPNPTTFAEKFFFTQASHTAASTTFAGGADWGNDFNVPADTYTLATPAIGRYVTFDILSSHGSPQVGLSEVRFSGTETTSWNLNGSGSWNAAANWSPQAVPNDTQTTVVFGSVISSPQTVVADTAFTTKGIRFQSPQSYAIAGLGSVTLDSNAVTADLEVVQGSHEFQVVVNLNDDVNANVAAGSILTFRNRLNLNGHTMTIATGGRIDVNHSETAAASGTIDNRGTLGVAGVSAINGDLVSTGTLDIDLGGYGDGEFDSFRVAGAATLSGLLDVELANGFVPSQQDRFTVLEAGALSVGNLALTGPAANLLTLSTMGNKLLLTAGVPGDYNANGVVDAADYTVWRDSLSSSVDLQADGDNSGTVDEADFLLWRTCFGNSTAGLGNAAEALIVPEPATTVLLLTIGLAPFGMRRQEN